MDMSLLLLLLLLTTKGGCNGENNNNGRNDDLRFGKDNYGNFNTFRDGRFEPAAELMHDDFDNFVTPFAAARNSIDDLELLTATMMFILFREINAPIAAVPVKRRRPNPFYNTFDDGFDDD